MQFIKVHRKNKKKFTEFPGSQGINIKHPPLKAWDCFRGRGGK